jgi:hypothetical protein
MRSSASRAASRAPAIGRVLYCFKLVFRDGTTHVLLSPTEFIERLAVQVPPPRRHLVTYHGVLAPAAGYRNQVMPEDRPYRAAVHRHRRTKEPGDADKRVEAKRRPALWAELFLRTFSLDALHCPLCGDRREPIALIPEASRAGVCPHSDSPGSIARVLDLAAAHGPIHTSDAARSPATLLGVPLGSPRSSQRIRLHVVG